MHSLWFDVDRVIFTQWAEVTFFRLHRTYLSGMEKSSIDGVGRVGGCAIVQRADATAH